MSDYPVVVIGSGPIGLAGPGPRERESTPLVLERGAALAKYHEGADRVELVLLAPAR
ncbi:hypothetical protein [Nocardia xishanensis]